jgi:hypothetical protein
MVGKSRLPVMSGFTTQVGLPGCQSCSREAKLCKLAQALTYSLFQIFIFWMAVLLLRPALTLYHSTLSF